MTSVARGSLIVFAAQLVANVGFFVAVLILARGLGPEGRGTIAFIIVSALVLARLSELGLSDATLVLASRRPQERRELLANQLAFGIATSTIVGGLASALLLALGQNAPAGIGPNEVALLFVGTIAVTVVDMTDAFVIGCGRIFQRAVVAALTPWVYASIAAAMLWSGGLTVAHAGAAWATANAISAAVLIGIAWRLAAPVRPALALLRESLAFGLRAWVGVFASFLNMRFDQILLGLISTQAALGIYAVAVNGSEVLLYFPAAVQTALTPALARVDQSIRHDQALRTFRILMLTTIASVVAAAIVGPRLLPLLFGARFDGSVAPFLWLLPGAIGFATSKIFNSALLASASAGRYSMSAIAALVVGILLDLMLIPQYGAVGAAAAASGAFVAGGVVAMLLYRSRSPFHWRSLVPGITDVATVGSLLTQLAGELGPAVRVRRLRSDAK